GSIRSIGFLMHRCLTGELLVANEMHRNDFSIGQLPSRAPQMNRVFSRAALGILAATAACNRTPPDDPRMPAEWIHTLYGAVRAERLSPPVASRIFAYAGTGLYAGMSAADPSLPTIAGRLNGLGELPRSESGKRYDRTLTAVAAERVILDSLFSEGLP